jgi:hypothetical protein
VVVDHTVHHHDVLNTVQLVVHCVLAQAGWEQQQLPADNGIVTGRSGHESISALVRAHAAMQLLRYGQEGHAAGTWQEYAGVCFMV